MHVCPQYCTTFISFAHKQWNILTNSWNGKYSYDTYILYPPQSIYNGNELEVQMSSYVKMWICPLSILAYLCDDNYKNVQAMNQAQNSLKFQRIRISLWPSEIVWNVGLIHRPCSTISHFLHHLEFRKWQRRTENFPVMLNITESHFIIHYELRKQNVKSTNLLSINENMN